MIKMLVKVMMVYIGCTDVCDGSGVVISGGLNVCGDSGGGIVDDVRGSGIVHDGGKSFLAVSMLVLVEVVFTYDPNSGIYGFWVTRTKLITFVTVIIIINCDNTNNNSTKVCMTLEDGWFDEVQ